MTPRQIAVAVVVRDGKVLVGRRSDQAREMPGCDEFPGGKVDPHETSAGAALRECLEETGIAVRVLERSFGIASTKVQPAIFVTFHWATPIDTAAQPRPPFEWVPIADLSSRNFPAANAAVLAILQHDHGGS